MIVINAMVIIGKVVWRSSTGKFGANVSKRKDKSAQKIPRPTINGYNKAHCVGFVSGIPPVTGINPL